MMPVHSPGTTQSGPAVHGRRARRGKLTGDRPRRSTSGRDHSGIWLRNAAAGLCVLAAAVVSFTAQYRLVYGTRRLAAAAGLEAAVPDAAALVFACAAVPGWRNLAIWSMPPVACALASDTLETAWCGPSASPAIRKDLDVAPAAGERTPLAVAGGLVLRLLRLTLAPVSTLAGFRAWVVGECPVAPGRRHPPGPRPASSPQAAGAPRPGKTARFLILVTERHGSLASIPLERVAGIAAALAPQAGLNAGSARAALRKAVLSAGTARVFSLHLRWGRLAALRRSARIRPSLPLRYRLVDSREHAVFLGRAHYRYGSQALAYAARRWPVFPASPAARSPPPPTATRNQQADNRTGRQPGDSRSGARIGNSAAPSSGPHHSCRRQTAAQDTPAGLPERAMHNYAGWSGLSLDRVWDCRTNGIEATIQSAGRESDGGEEPRQG